MRSRWLLAVMVAASFSACASGASSSPASSSPVAATPRPTLESSPIVFPTHDVTQESSPIVFPTPSQESIVFGEPTPVPTLPSGADLARMTIICADLNPDTILAERECAGLLYSALGLIGVRAHAVTRMAAGDLVSMLGCKCNVIAGFQDGHLEGLNAKGEVVSLDPSAWPWGESATFNSPSVSRPKLGENPPAAVANRSPLPYCGISSYPETFDPYPCFRQAVMGGHPAEMAVEAPGYEGGWYIRIYRFTGSGAIVVHSSAYDQSTNGQERWTSMAGAMYTHTDGTWTIGGTPELE